MMKAIVILKLILFSATFLFATHSSAKFAGSKKRNNQSVEAYAQSRAGSEEFLEQDIQVFKDRLANIRTKNAKVADSPFKTEIFNRADAIEVDINLAEAKVANAKDAQDHHFDQHKTEIKPDLDSIAHSLAKLESALEKALPSPPDGM